MNKIIKGKRYDTETAKHIATAYSIHPRNDFSYWEEELYRKKTGEFFIYGWGNANSRYSKSAGFNTWTGSEKIIPITESEARAWAEDHLLADEFEKYFDVAPEDYVIQSVTMPASLNAIVREVAAAEGSSISAIVTEALEKFFS